jgi:L-malate glycosyltransferase
MEKKVTRVIHLLSGREGGGIGKVIGNLLKHNDSQDIVSSCIFLSKGRLWHEFRALGIPCLFIPKRFRGDLLVIKKIIRFCADKGVDILHTHSITGNLYGRLAGMLIPDVCIITTVHAKTFDELAGRYKIKFAVRLIHQADIIMSVLSYRLVAVSHSLKEYLVSKGICPEKIEIITHGINDDYLIAGQDEVRQVRQFLKIHQEETVIGIVGRLTRVKRHDIFLKAAQKVLQRYKKCRFLIVGDGPLRKELEIMCYKLGISEKVQFYGWADKIAPLLNIIDIQVQVSESEGFGYAVLEGMACSKAIISTAVSELPRIISHGKTGLLIPPDDSESLFNAIKFFAENPDKMLLMGKNARTAVFANFSLAEEINRTSDLYRNAVKKRGAEQSAE